MYRCKYNKNTVNGFRFSCRTDTQFNNLHQVIFRYIHPTTNNNIGIITKVLFYINMYLYFCTSICLYTNAHGYYML